MSVVLIVKNEARRLGAAIDSVSCAGEVIVCDTGSRDATIAVAEQAGARVFESTWTDDFAAARTNAQGHARYPWVMRLDADEVLCVAGGTSAEWLVEAIARAERADADRIFVRRRYDESNAHWFLRLFRADRFVWVHPLHEVLAPIGERRRAIAMQGAVVLHRPSRRPRGYAALASRHLAHRPGDPHLRYYFARALWEESRLEEAIPALRAYLAEPRDYRFHRGEAHRMLGCALAATAPDEARRHLVEAIGCDGMRAEAIVDIVRLSLARGEREEARRWINTGANAVPPFEVAPWGGRRLPYLLDERAWRPSTWQTLWREAA